MSSGVNFAVSPLWWSVALGKGHQLQHVEGIFSASNILLNVLNPTSFSGEQIKRVKRNEGGKEKKRKEKKKVNMNEFFNCLAQAFKRGLSPKTQLNVFSLLALIWLPEILICVFDE